jgi:hypothetical protein
MSTSSDPPPTFNMNTPAASPPPAGIQSDPATEKSKEEAYKVNGDSGAMFEAPKLFNPKDRTAQRSIAPVRTAVYEQPVSYRNTSTVRRGPVSDEQARIDAIGWTSGSK